MRNAKYTIELDRSNYMIIRDVEVWQTLKNTPGISMTETPTTGYWYYVFNTRREPLDDPNRQGFDEFFGYVNMFHAHNFYPEFLVENGKKLKLRNIVKQKFAKFLRSQSADIAEAMVLFMAGPPKTTRDRFHQKVIEARIRTEWLTNR